MNTEILQNKLLQTVEMYPKVQCQLIVGIVITFLITK